MEAQADAWDAHVRPLLESKCLKCHGGVKQKGGLDLRSLPSILEGGETGPAVVPGKPDTSLLFELIQPGADPHMPPKGEPLTSEETLLMRVWIEGLDGKTIEANAQVEVPAWAPPEGTTLTEAIDLQLEAGWQKESVQPAAVCDDETYVRRAYIDLIGRIPTASERSGFLQNPASDKRAALVSRLMESAEFPRHMSEIFDTVFLRRDSDGQSRRGDRQSNKWFDYLSWAFSTNRAWDQMAADLLLARPGSKEESGASWFLAEKKDDPNIMATEAARTLLGKQIQCAQCHDHPVSPEIEHKHYWGMVAFFKRSFRVKTPEGIRVAESATGGYSEYKDLGGQSFEAELAFLNGKTLPEERNEGPEAAELYTVAPPDSYFEQVAKKDDDKKKDKKKRRGPPEMPVLPVPKQSRRALLSQEIINDNPDFAAAAVNRFWAYLTGRGLVHPVDQMDSAHPASHPQLLAWLAREFAANGYDARRLIAGIMASKAYQLDSAHPAQRPPLPQTFARMVPKPLPAESLYRSLLVAAGNAPEADGTFKDIDTDQYRRLLIERFPALFPEVVSPNVGQSLFFTNNPLVQELISATDADVPENTTARMIAETNHEARTRLAFEQVLGRAPDSEELAQAVAYFENRPANTAAAEQLLWALIAGSEFRFNR